MTVRLDAQTGICVYVGPAPENPRYECDLDPKIVAVDARMDDSLFVRAGR
ncbi:hypothetical protein [Rhodococcus sp. 1168]|nr:hypothetical protein [Rhodococcus sp. 1168]